jgi:hypothetical protein
MLPDPVQPGVQPVHRPRPDPPSLPSPGECPPLSGSASMILAAAR